ncbi:hypothetical protein GTA08_BOTSDO12655 [Botryosphaeria dothidea]|uniref:Uncharacterized protein n=1 Tax=Botryosphaeria dothidea TaxID=55169 RepID=A0A8H4NE22_9PEZI|nr:hypothetical protein GTA08_BOTSDO12655 [Botryosphaeria dothidea]
MSSPQCEGTTVKGGRCLKGVLEDPGSATSTATKVRAHTSKRTILTAPPGPAESSGRTPSTARNQNRATPVATVPDQCPPAHNQRSATPASSVPDERQSAHRDRYTEQCRRVRANGQRCGRQTTAINNDFCTGASGPARPLRAAETAACHSPPLRAPASSAPRPRSARILASFAVEDLQAEVLRRIPV